MLRKFTPILSVAVLASMGLTACSDTSSTDAAESTATETAESAAAEAASGTITVENNLGTVELTLPVKRVASLDNRTFEVLEAWDVDLVAAPLDLIPNTVTAYTEDTTANVGNHREPDLEALVAAEPDLIISGQRFFQYNEDIAALTDAPLIDLEPRDGKPLDSELIRQVTTLGDIFSKQSEAQALVDDFNAAIERVKAAYDGTSTVMAVNVSGGEIGYIAPSEGRTFGPLFDLLGWKAALQLEEGTDSHTGDDISVEAIAESNPDWIFVLDRDGAISADDESYSPAEEVISSNAALQNVTAVAEKHVVVAPRDTYTNESIITYTEILNSIADAFENAAA